MRSTIVPDSPRLISRRKIARSKSYETNPYFYPPPSPLESRGVALSERTSTRLDRDGSEIDWCTARRILDIHFLRNHVHIHTRIYSYAFRLLRALAPCAALRSELVGLNLAWEENALSRFATRKPLPLARLCDPIDICTKATTPIRVHQTAARQRGISSLIDIARVSRWRNPSGGIQGVETFFLQFAALMNLKYVSVSTLTKVSQKRLIVSATYSLFQFLRFLYKMNSNCLLMENEGSARYERKTWRRDKFSILLRVHEGNSINGTLPTVRSITPLCEKRWRVERILSGTLSSSKPAGRLARRCCR